LGDGTADRESEIAQSLDDVDRQQVTLSGVRRAEHDLRAQSWFQAAAISD